LCKKEEKSIEILSPAKNLFYGKEVIRCGADAVYIGTPKHSMRQEHTNSLDDIKKLIDYAHKYWVKVYAAVNCLLYKQEDVNCVKEMINKLYEMEADGIIIQDLGILELDLPPIPVILSTNTMCYKKEDVQFFEKIGVSRVVLPRDISIEEIEDITKNSNISIEAFCYGYYCPVVCGNCYLSYVEKLLETKIPDKAIGVSPNNGMCAERCMGNWTLKDANGNIIKENDRLMNVRYLSLDDEVEHLFKTGIDSFKIAGREKDLKHAKNSTAIFSEEANKVCRKLGIKRSSSGKVILGYVPDLNKNFNKGYSKFFLYGKDKEMYSKYRLIGENVGKVISFKDNSFELYSDKELEIGDKLRYKIGNEKVKKIEIINKTGNRYKINPINDNIEGLELYRYINVKGFKEAEESVNYRVISTSVAIRAIDGNYEITAKDEDNNKIEFSYPKGNNPVDNIQDALYKLDIDCEFVINEVKTNSVICCNDIADLKNKIFELLRKERAKNRPRKKGQIIKNNVPYYKKELTYLANVTNNYTKAFYERHGVEKIEPGFETGISIEEKKVFRSRYCLRNELGVCSKTKPKKIPPLPWKIEQLESGITYNIEFDCENCFMNFYVDNE